MLSHFGINRLNNTVDILTRGHVKNAEVGEINGY